jgi:hypothetical protein
MPANLNLAHDADPMRDDHLELLSLLARARNGEEQAWDTLVDRYAPLIWSICRRYRLADADAKDVSQSVWLHLVDHLGRIRDPAALPRLARDHDPAGMRPGAGHSAATAGYGVRAGCRGHPR